MSIERDADGRVPQKQLREVWPKIDSVAADSRSLTL